MLLTEKNSLCERWCALGTTVQPHCKPLSVYGQDDLDLIALKLNTRPRKTLGYSTPAATLANTVALTG